MPGGFEGDLEVEDGEATYQDWEAQQGERMTEIFVQGGVRRFYGKDLSGHLLAVYHQDRACGATPQRGRTVHQIFVQTKIGQVRS